MLRFKLAKAFEILVTLKFLPFWSKKMNTFLFIFYIAAKKTSHMACQIHILKLILHMKHMKHTCISKNMHQKKRKFLQFLALHSHNIILCKSFLH